MDEQRGFWFWLALSAVTLAVTGVICWGVQMRADSACVARGGQPVSGLCIKPGALLSP